MECNSVLLRSNSALRYMERNNFSLLQMTAVSKINIWDSGGFFQFGPPRSWYVATHYYAYATLYWLVFRFTEQWENNKKYIFIHIFIPNERLCVIKTKYKLVFIPYRGLKRNRSKHYLVIVNLVRVQNTTCSGKAASVRWSHFVSKWWIEIDI